MDPNNAPKREQNDETSSNIAQYQPSETKALPPTPETPRTVKRAGRRKINIEFIDDKSRRHITFSKRKAGIMKKAYELSTLTGTQVLLLVASETGHVYTFATPKLQPLITKPEGKNLIQACLNAPDTLQAQQNPHGGAQLSPGTPGGYGHQQEHPGMQMSQRDYMNQPSPAQSPYDDDEKASISYGMQRSSFSDLKNYQTSSPSGHEHSMPEHSMGGYPYSPSPHMMNSNPGIRMPYSNGPSLPTLTDRGSFSNLPNHSPYNHNQYQPQSNMPSYAGPMGGTFPSQTFPSSGPSQLFSKASNLPTLPRHD